MLVMKKIFLVLVFSLVAILIKPQEIRAACYYSDNSGYATCMGGTGARRCQSGGAYYACCNANNDVCPAVQTQPGQIPTVPDPLADPNCGGTSQPCCSGNRCDTSSLQCVGAGQAGLRCLSQAQINAGGGSISGGNATNTNNATGGIDVSKCDNGETGIQTAIGCIHALSTPEAFLSDILKWAVGIGGGIAFILIIYAGFMVMTAAGNPERLKAGQELLTSAISGLILLVFSIFILKFIGVDILGLCKFGFGKC